MAQQVAKINYLKIAPRKVRLVANTLKGLSAQEAEAQLLHRLQRSSEPLLKLVRSCVANARNNKLDVSKLVVASITVDQGPILKRFLPRAMGRATSIHKKMSHVTLVLKEAENKSVNRFVINPPVKKSSAAPKKERTKKATAEQDGKPVEKKGFLKRMFNRKSV